MFLNKIKGWIRKNSFCQKAFYDAIWKAQRYEIAMSAIELNSESKFEENKFIRFETERTITMNIDVVKLLNSLGIVVGDTVNLNIIDNRDTYNNLLQNKENKIEIIIPGDTN